MVIAEKQTSFWAPAIETPACSPTVSVCSFSAGIQAIELENANFLSSSPQWQEHRFGSTPQVLTESWSYLKALRRRSRQALARARSKR